MWGVPDSVWLTALTGLFGVMFTVGKMWISSVQRDQKELEKKLQEVQHDVAKNYVTKDDHEREIYRSSASTTQLFGTVLSHIERLEKKVDTLLTRD